jgi:hypothetical protein
VIILVTVGCASERDRPGGESTGLIHPSGILDEESENFHGKELARRGYDLNLCASCHGDDFTGGKAGASCTTCHTEGPTACVTCHGDGPTTGNHAVHRVEGMLGCAECHTVPTAWDSPGHIGSVEVTFGALASKTPASFADGTCTVYCHGSQRPAWTAEPMRGCDRCHGAPPAAPHPPQSQCASCHPAGAAHIDGIAQVGSACDSCHGRAGDPAPPKDLQGNEFTTALGVGAHQAHLDVPSGIAAAIACGTCHVVPATTNAAGHIDTPLPAEVMQGLGWDRQAGTCGTAWCHGPSRPVWTQSGGAFCGSCHGVPPATPSHDPSMNLTTCTSCHPAGFVKHIDGVLDVL